MTSSFGWGDVIVTWGAFDDTVLDASMSPDPVSTISTRFIPFIHSTLKAKEDSSIGISPRFSPNIEKLTVNPAVSNKSPFESYAFIK